jgi:signal recognition particle receptor subunit beta
VALLDPRENVIVLRVAYDGPAEAGKTTSVRALARSVGREMFTPEESSGRTVHFDWLEYTGGRFEGLQIRCQIASVPGQKSRARRRKHILSGADVIVFVGDTTIAAWGQTLDQLRALRAWIDGRDGTPIAVVFQANKRDLVDVIPMDTVRDAVAPYRIGVVESIAQDGTGIREAFVFAVRLALDRVRDEQQHGRLPATVSVDDGAAELLAALRGLDEEHLVPPPLPDPPEADPEVSGSESEPEPAAPPLSPAVPAAASIRPPGIDAPLGGIWPPVDGRIVLHDFVARGAAAIRLADDGSWIGDDDDAWIVHADAGARFADLDAGRDALVQWARRHAAARTLLSDQRCIVLHDGGDGSWRLWQIVRLQPSLRRRILDQLDGGDPIGLARRITAATRLLHAAAALADATGLRLPCTIDTIGEDELERPRYIGLVPGSVHAGDAGAAGPRVDGHAHMARELAAIARQRGDADHRTMVEALRQVRGSGAPGGTRITQLLAALLD